MTKLVLISDTHGLHRSVDLPAGDILIHAGDLSNKGSLEDLTEFIDWLAEQPHQHKIIIAGNHDFCFERQGPRAREICAGITYLQDSSVRVSGLKIYGSPWQPRFFDWAFNVDRGPKLAAIWSQIPTDTDVLVTHGPPYGILDQTRRGPVGCQDLMLRIEEVKPRVHIFGHIHEGYGQYQGEYTHFVNASICDLGYQPCNLPIVVEL